MLVKKMMEWLDGEFRWAMSMEQQSYAGMEDQSGRFFFRGYQKAIDRIRWKIFEYESLKVEDEKKEEGLIAFAEDEENEGRNKVVITPLSSVTKGGQIDCEKHGSQDTFLTQNRRAYCIKCWEEQMAMSAMKTGVAGHYDKDGNPVFESVSLLSVESKKK